VSGMYGRVVVVLAAAMVILGFVMLVVTAAHGGGVVGYVVGALFIALGVGRIRLQRKVGGGS
jgi:hypothetical protein